VSVPPFADPSPWARRADPIGYAFRADGSLDPGSKLLDIGLHGYTPIAALQALVDEPLHMSVALHEVTHFVSLQNILGVLLGFWAMRADSIGDGLLHYRRTGQQVEPWAVRRYHWGYRKYRLLMEAWRPLLEGLAVYAQTHRADEAGDAWIAPLSLIVRWKALVNSLGARRTAPLSAGNSGLDELSGGLLAAGYRAIREGPGLRLGDRPFAASLEMLSAKGLLPYFLGHAYLRAMQRCLARASPEYASSERFFGLILRILGSSTRRLLRAAPEWDRPAGADLLYGWVDIVRRTERERIGALSQLDKNIDVLHFLETGESEVGCGTTDADLAQDLRELVPDDWEAYDGELSDRQSLKIARGLKGVALGPGEFAERVLTHWIRGTASLNLSMDGEATIVGVVPNGFRPRHALALKVEDRLWWIAATEDQLPRLIGDSAQVPTLDERTMEAGGAQAVPDTGCRILIDCFYAYVSEGETLAAPDRPSLSLPELLFELRDGAGRGESVLASVAPALAAFPQSHLEVLADAGRSTRHRASMQMRRSVLNAQSPRKLAEEFKGYGNPEIGALLGQGAAEVSLAVSRVEEQVIRRILRGLLGRVPESDIRVPLLSKGVGMIEGAAEMESLIVAAYGADCAIGERASDAVAGKIRSINERSRRLIGKSLFELCPSGGRVTYCGLWGDT
jgi:hypothetical protein